MLNDGGIFVQDASVRSNRLEGLSVKFCLAKEIVRHIRLHRYSRFSEESMNAPQLEVKNRIVVKRADNRPKEYE